MNSKSRGNQNLRMDFNERMTSINESFKKFQWKAIPQLGLLLIFLFATLLASPIADATQDKDRQGSGKAKSDNSETQNQTKTVDEKGGIDFPIDLTNPLSVEEQLAADKISQNLGSSIRATEWLGPLAPISLSPFFGITCLSGMATYGSDWFEDRNSFLSKDSPLSNPALFWTFFVLTILTALPKLTKVSKPIAQVADVLEMYSAIITLIVLKLLITGSSSAAPEVTEPAQAGLLSFSYEAFLILAMIVNVIVVNTVKFFFEILIWITPVPFLDACFEVANKTICSILLLIYAFSPLLATVINFILFVICMFVFRWARRQIIFYRSMLLDIAMGWIWKDRGVLSKPEMTLFPQKAFGAMKAKSKATLTVTEDKWIFSQKRLFTRPHNVEIDRASTKALITRGLLVNRLHFGEDVFLFSRRYNDNLEQFAKNIGAIISESAAPSAAKVAVV